MAGKVRIVLLLCVVSAVVLLSSGTAIPEDDLAVTDIPVTQKPSTIYLKKRLEQLKKMEESALKGWYDLVQEFLILIKPDDRVIEIIIDYVQGTLLFEFPSSVMELAKQNSVFLAMVSLGLAYVIIMLSAGFIFLCCRMCGRCGAKESQRQTRNINCWRTTHKFCLVLFIAFLVVPITCMFIINEHMRRSLPSVKRNATSIFPMLYNFANDTEKEVNDIAKEQFNDIIKSVQDKDNFEKGFAVPLESDIVDAFTPERFNQLEDFVSWVLTVKTEYVPEVKELTVKMSADIQELRSIVKNLTEETEKFEAQCSSSGSNVCKIILGKLSVDKMDISHIQVEVDKKLQRLLDADSEELKNIAEKMQNKTFLSSMIREKREDLKKFLDRLKPRQDEILESIKKSVKKYADSARELASEGQRIVNIAVDESETYDVYRWWFMLGVSVVLVIPVAFLVLGLVCGCCGHRKGYHPSKRSRSSHCGGFCLVLAVYYFFLVSWLLMLITLALFVLGGNAQSFACIPLSKQNFTILDQVKEKLSSESDSSDFVPSKLLNDCQNDVSIFEALDLFNESASKVLKEELEKKFDNDKLKSSLHSSISAEISKVQDYIDEFLKALNVSQVKNLPEKLQTTLNEMKSTIEETKQQVQRALPQNPDLSVDLKIIERTALSLGRTMDSLDSSLESLSSLLLKVHEDAIAYTNKIRSFKGELKIVGGKIPSFVDTRLYLYVADIVNTDISDKLRYVGRCEPVWLAFDTAVTVVCDFIVYPVNGFWFGLGWCLVCIIPTIIFAIKLSRHYLRMKYDDDTYRYTKKLDEREVILLDEVNRPKPFSYTNPGTMGWMPQTYVVHPTANNNIRQFDYK